MVNIKRLVLQALAQTVAILLVCGVVVVVMRQLQKWESPTDGYLDKVALLLLFAVSALVSAVLALAYPSYLVLQQRLREGFLLVLATVGWLVVILGGILALIVFRDIHMT
jgi:drug/metabolite transporter (DMT)-like permease